MTATGVRSSWEATATNRRSVSNAWRMGTSARRVMSPVTTAAPSVPNVPTIVIAMSSWRSCSMCAVRMTPACR